MQSRISPANPIALPVVMRCATRNAVSDKTCWICSTDSNLQSPPIPHHGLYGVGAVCARKRLCPGFPACDDRHGSDFGSQLLINAEHLSGLSLCLLSLKMIKLLSKDHLACALCQRAQTLAWHSRQQAASSQQCTCVSDG